MWFDGIRRPDTIYVADTSRGKDSTAMLRAIQLMGWPLDMICAVDIWATQDIPAELPPMVAFKDEYAQKVLDWFGVPVTRLCATIGANTLKPRKLTYEDIFYRKVSAEKERERDGRPGDRTIYGFPQMGGTWCNSDLKRAAMASRSVLSATGVPLSKDSHQRLSVDKRSVVSGQTQGKAARRPFRRSPGTRGRK